LKSGDSRILEVAFNEKVCNRAMIRKIDQSKSDEGRAFKALPGE
jgi:hypothetical protein